MSVIKYSEVEIIKRCWGLVGRPRRVQIAFLFCLMVISSLAEAISIGAVIPLLSILVAPEKIFRLETVQPIIKLIDLTQPKDLLLPITIVFTVATVFSASIRLALTWTQVRLGAAIANDFSIGTYNRILYQPYAYHVTKNSSEIISVVWKAGEIGNVIINPCLTLLNSALLLGTILTGIMFINTRIAISVFLGFGAIYFGITYLAKRRLAVDSERVSRESVKMVKALQEGLGGIRDVLIDGAQSAYLTLFRNASIPMRRAAANISMIGQSPRFIIEALGMLLIAYIAYIVSISSEGILSAIPFLGALVMCAQRLLPALQQAYAAVTLIRGNLVSTVDVLNILEQPIPLYYLSQPINSLQFYNSISLENLSFRYTLETPWVLRGVNLHIPKGARVGIIGITGSGKSTLMDILMGLLAPTEGKLLIDGKKITEKNRRAWQAHISHVPQTIYLSDASIAENIAFGISADQIDLCRVKRAAQRAQIATTIESWDNQYDTKVGERGVRLSGGQRQRIGIARALYKNADVIVFDEATSALDNETEMAIIESIEALGENITVLIIAHRLTTLKNCTHIFKIIDGCASHIGLYQDLHIDESK